MVAAELARMQQQEADTKAKQLEVKHELESHDNTIKENQQRIRHWKKEVSDILEFMKQMLIPYIGFVSCTKHLNISLHC